MALPPTKEWPEFTTEQFERFRLLLQEKCGMYFDSSKLGVMRSVIQDRLAAHNLTDYDAYYRLLLETSHTQKLELNQPPTGQRALSREMRRLVESLAVNETSFFRNKEHYRAIKEEVLPRLIRRHTLDRKLRIWSAGCSTGQEPYTLAMAVLETLAQMGHDIANWKIEIVASDISERALRVAHAGRYRSEDMRGLAPEQIARFFRPLSAASVTTAPLDPSDIFGPDRAHLIRHRPQAAFEVSPQVRDMVKFHFLNLVNPNYPPDKFNNFDLVLCENVTIYFTPEITRQVIHKIGAVMNEGAFLFIGYSETLWQVSDRFKLINTQDTFYYQKPFPNEDPRLYVRHAPTTGPLSSQTIKPSTTDQLPTKSVPDRVGKTDPLPDMRRAERNLPAKEPPEGVQTRYTRPNYNYVPPTAPRKTQEINKPSRPELPLKTWQELLTEGRQKMAEHDFDKALATLELALAVGPQQVEVLCTMAELKGNLGDYKTATQLCQRAIQIDSLAEPAHLMLALLHQKAGQTEKAIEEFKRAIYINLDSVIAHMHLADIYQRTGRQREALREYKQAQSVLQQKNSEEIIEGFPVALLIQTCQQNIIRLTPRQSR